jgi:hypothetical protein
MERKFGRFLLDNVYEYIHKQITKDMVNEYNDLTYYEDEINCLKMRQNEYHSGIEFNWRRQDRLIYYGHGSPIYNCSVVVGLLPKNY